MNFNVDIDLDSVLWEVDDSDLIEHLEDQGYTVLEKGENVGEMEDDEIINAICDRFGMPYTSSKKDVLSAFTEKILKL